MMLNWSELDDLLITLKRALSGLIHWIDRTRKRRRAAAEDEDQRES